MTKSKGGFGRKFIVVAIQFCPNENKSGNVKLAGKFYDNSVKNGDNAAVFTSNL